MTDRQLYLEILKRALNNYLYLGGTESFQDYRTLGPRRYKQFRWLIPESSRPHTLLSKNQLDRLERILVESITKGIPGDFIEAGVCRGGATIFMKAVVKAYAARNRVVWVADSFRGIPLSTRTVGDPVDKWEDRWAVPLNQVKANFARYGLLDNRVRFIRGSFQRALRRAPLKHLAVVRLDGDSYESTLDALEVLYPKISVGGYLYIDDWHLPGCRAAVMEYRSSHKITEHIDESVDAMWKIRRRPK